MVRTFKTLNGVETQYFLDGSSVIAQNRGGTTDWFSYDADGRVRVMEYNNGTTVVPYYYIYNAQGDVLGLIDSNRNIVVRYTYDSWGKLLSTTGSLATTLGVINPFRYKGYFYDTESGFYYLQSRYYDPGVGRFLNADGLISTGTGMLGHNMYAYCDNNPVINSDPSGTCTVEGVTITKFCNDPHCDKKDPFTQAGHQCRDNCEPETYKRCQPSKAWIIPQDVVNKNKAMIKELDLELQFLALEFLAKANDAGYAVFITWGKRSNKQEAQFPDGVKYGPHTKGIAFDVSFWDSSLEGVWPETDPMSFWSSSNHGTWNPNDPRWAKIGSIGESVGLKWGGRFKSPDVPHFRLN